MSHNLLQIHRKTEFAKESQHIFPLQIYRIFVVNGLDLVMFLMKITSLTYIGHRGLIISQEPMLISRVASIPSCIGKLELFGKNISTLMSISSCSSFFMFSNWPHCSEIMFFFSLNFEVSYIISQQKISSLYGKWLQG